MTQWVYGFGGGSADAAAMLRLLAAIGEGEFPLAELRTLALGLGADVPACLISRACEVRGVGEIVHPLRAFPATHLVLVNPLQPSGLVDSLPSPSIVPWRSRGTLASTRRAMPDADDAARMHAFRRWRDESGAVLDEARAGVAIEAPACPVLVFASEHDTDVPAPSSGLLAATLEADFETVAGASHVGPLLGRSAARTAERVADWLAQHHDALGRHGTVDIRRDYLDDTRMEIPTGVTSRRLRPLFRPWLAGLLRRNRG